MLRHGRKHTNRTTAPTRTRRSASLHGKNMMEGHGPSWPPLLMEGHALSWPQAHEPNHDPKDGRDGARPSRENARNTDATECVPPWEKPDGGPRSLVAASSDGGPCSVMAASTRTEPRPQRRTRRSASLHGKNMMEGPGPLWPPLLMEGHALSWPQAHEPNHDPKDGRDGVRPSMGKTRWRATVPRGRLF
jgi:hypothetical protein